MPYRLGFPTRKFVATFFDPVLEDEGLPFEDCFYRSTFYTNDPEEVVMMASVYAERNEVFLKAVSEVYWEDEILYD